MQRTRAVAIMPAGSIETGTAGDMAETSAPQGGNSLGRSLATFLDRQFGLTENGTTVRTEFVAGMTTFLTMVYIVFVNPEILANTGMDRGAVFVATCLAAAISTLIMALYANYPIALAPGHGAQRVLRLHPGARRLQIHLAAGALVRVHRGPAGARHHRHQAARNHHQRRSRRT